MVEGAVALFLGGAGHKGYEAWVVDQPKRRRSTDAQ